MSVPALVSPGHRFWPVGEAAQADYEALRAHVLAIGAAPDSLIAARFARRGPAGVEQQGEPGGERVEPGIVVRGPRRARRAQQCGVEHRVGAGPGDQPG